MFRTGIDGYILASDTWWHPAAIIRRSAK